MSNITALERSTQGNERQRGMDREEKREKYRKVTK